MNIRYSNTHGDLIRCQIRMLLTNKLFLIVFACLGLFTGNGFFNNSSIADSALPTRILISLFCVALVLSGGLFIGFLFLVVTVYKNSKGVVGEHELIITDEGLEEITEFNRSLVKWSGIKGIQESRNYYYLFIAGNAAHVIPKNRPLIEGDILPFIQEFKEKLNGA